MNNLPPLTGTPLDYVPIDAPKTRSKPFDFTAPVVRRSVISAGIAAAAISFVVFPPLGLTALAVAAVSLAVYGGGKLADQLNAYDDN